ncbi:hypothetical protein NPIL_47021 [Nephila pilipes]|uniref:Uncharacterized protein n=1 Tax=Nephila pilipes TaxID=299642 RepID=A0A8X6UCU9_NEPPI|nr:hypothetical protein NPIL_47021 [Nephila pilipes]
MPEQRIVELSRVTSVQVHGASFFLENMASECGRSGASYQRGRNIMRQSGDNGSHHWSALRETTAIVGVFQNREKSEEDARFDYRECSLYCAFRRQ